MLNRTNTVGFLVGAVFFSTIVASGAYAQIIPTAHPWRTPPVKTTGNETVSCDLVNNSGKDIITKGLVIQAKSLEGGARVVVSVPNSMTLKDGGGVRGSTPNGVLNLQTVYCEISSGGAISVKQEDLFFTMTVQDSAGKVTTVASPRLR